MNIVKQAKNLNVKDNNSVKSFRCDRCPVVVYEDIDYVELCSWSVFVLYINVFGTKDV